MKIKMGFLHHQCTFVLFLRLVCLISPNPAHFFKIQVSVLPKSWVFPRHYFQGQCQVEAIPREPSNTPKVFHSGGQFLESL